MGASFGRVKQGEKVFHSKRASVRGRSARNGGGTTDHTIRFPMKVKLTPVQQHALKEVMDLGKSMFDKPLLRRSLLDYSKLQGEKEEITLTAAQLDRSTHDEISNKILRLGID